MPRLSDMESHSVAGTNFGYSAVKLQDLGETEYTLVTLVQDESGSVSPFKNDMEKCLGQVVMACGHSPRANNLLLRMIAFNGSLREVHGFKALKDCNPDDYKKSLRTTGNTALYDAIEDGVRATLSFGGKVNQVDIDANALVVVITDGCDNASTATLHTLEGIIAKVRQDESLQNLTVVIVGVNVTDPLVGDYLDKLRAVVGADKFVAIADASPGKLAKLAEFVSRSISSVSQSLASGTTPNVGSLTI